MATKMETYREVLNGSEGETRTPDLSIMSAAL